MESDGAAARMSQANICMFAQEYAGPRLHAALGSVVTQEKNVSSKDVVQTLFLSDASLWKIWAD